MFKDSLIKFTTLRGLGNPIIMFNNLEWKSYNVFFKSQSNQNKNNKTPDLKTRHNNHKYRRQTHRRIAHMGEKAKMFRRTGRCSFLIQSLRANATPKFKRQTYIHNQSAFVQGNY